jgi:tetratricopeptide (TPR) repeat protein
MRYNYSNLLKNEAVTKTGIKLQGKFLVVLAVFAAVVASPKLGVSQKMPAAGPPLTSGSTKKIPASSVERLTQEGELQRRYEALHAAANGGKPEAVSRAARAVAAVALRQLANVRMLQRAFPQAVELYRQSIALEDTPDIRVNLAIAALQAGQPDESIEQTRTVLQSQPGNARAWHIQGKAWMAKDDYRSALGSLSKSAQLQPDVNAQYALAFSYLKLGEKPKAEDIFQQIIATYGDKAIWHVVFGGAYRDSKSPVDAIREFKRAIAIDPTVGHAHFFLALTLLEENHWAQTEESLAEFREAVKQDPKDFFSNFYLGAGESELKIFNDSNRHLKVASELQPATPEVWIYLGLNAFQQNDYPLAKRYLTQGVALVGAKEDQYASRLKRAYIALGRIAFAEGNKQESEKYIRRAKVLQNKSLAESAESIAETMSAGGMGQQPAAMPNLNVPKQQLVVEEKVIDPTGPVDPSLAAAAPLSSAEQEQVRALEKQLRALLSSAYNDWGTADARQEMYRHAIDRFREAEKWDNSTPGLMRNLGMAASKIGDSPEAIRALSVAAQQDPQDQQVRSRLAMTQFGADQYADAVKTFDEMGVAVTRDPRLAYAFGYSLVKINQPKRATEVLNQLSNLEMSAEMLISVGDLYGVLEDYEHAIASYRRAISLNPTIPKARYKMGAALLRLSRPGDAVHELQAELKISPDDPDVQYNLAYALLQTSQKEQALELLRSILDRYPNHPQAQYQMGKTLLDEGQFNDAVHHLELAAKLDPGRDYIHYQLLTAYRRVGRTDEAERESKIYKEIKARKRDKVVLPMPERKE